MNATEKRKGERDKQKFLEQAIDNEALMKEAEQFAHLGSWQVDLLSGNAKWSDEAYRILGYQPSEIQLTAEIFLRHVHPEDLSFVKRALSETFKNLSSLKLSYRINDKNGHLKFMHTALRVKRQEGKPVRLTGFIHDVTEIRNTIDQKKKAELELQSAYEKLLFHIENTPLGFIEWDNKLCIRSLSKRAEEIFGWNLQEFILNEKTGYTEVYIEDQLQVYKVIEQLLGGKVERNHVQHRNYTKGGKVIWCDWFNSVLKDKNGRVITIMSLIQDITEAKAAEEKIKQSESKLKEAQAIARVGSWDVDMLHDTQEWSDELYNIYGIEKDENVRPFTELFLSFFHPDDLAFGIAQVENAFSTLIDSSFNFHFIKKTGETRFGYAEWRFEFDQNKRPIRLYGIVKDISEQRKSEDERAKMIDDIIQRNKNLEQFSYIVSHNLRMPTANIIGCIELLKTGDLPEETLTQVNEGLYESVKKLDEVIKDLNSILKVKRDVNEIKEVIDFSQLVKDIRLSLATMIEKEKAIIVCDFSEVEEVLSFKSYMNSIFYNLISNSLKYGRPDISPVIEIKSQKTQDEVVLVFKDNGMGIDLEKKGDQVFGLYKRFHTDKAEGKGMGLFMVKTQVETIGGKISIRSEVNKGTEFRIEFKL